MTDEEVVTDSNYLRGSWMLDHQIADVGDLVRFWKLFGSARVDYPEIELHPTWDVLY